MSRSRRWSLAESSQSAATSAPMVSALNDADRATFLSCDIVIHSAAAVAFDSPLDSAVEINLLGPTRIVDTLNAAGVDAASGRRQHVLRRRQPARQCARGTRQRGTVRHRAELAQGGGRSSAAAQRHRSASAVSPRSSRTSAARPAESSARLVPRRSPPRPRASARTGSRINWSRPAGPAPPASAGPMRTPTPRHSASRR